MADARALRPWLWAWGACWLLWGAGETQGAGEGPLTHVECQTRAGRVRGYLHRVPQLGASTERFFAIPYASPPLGRLRLEPPQPPVAWDGVKNATELPPACLQDSHVYVQNHHPEFGDLYSEDCLYLNVYVPRLEPRAQGLPVLVHVHGGSNMEGMGALLHADVLAILGTMVIVNFNYRLGPLGFLGLGEEGFRGNFGILDQHAALTWVRDNIHHFGGDPLKVTLQGHSSGSADAGVHVLSPLSRGLFRYAVMQSGSPLSYFGVEQPPWSMRNYTLQQAAKLRCDVSASARLIKKCLQSLPSGSFSPLKIDKYPYLIDFYPVAVDGHVLTESPEEILRSGTINGEAFLIGVTADDGGKGNLTPQRYLHYRLEKELPHALPPTDAVWQTRSFPDIVDFEYTPRGLDATNGTAHALAFGNILGDAAVRAPGLRMADLLSARGLPTYFYSFDVDSALTPEIGVPHGADIFYLWGCPLVGHPSFAYGDVERDVSREMASLWTHFVTDGRPLTRQGRQLQLFDNATEAYFQVALASNESAVVRQRYALRAHQVALWNELLPRLAEQASRDKAQAVNGCSLLTAGCSSSIVVHLLSLYLVSISGFC